MLHGVVLHVDVGEVAASLQVVQLVEVLDIIALEVEHCQVLYEADIEQLVDLVVADVQLLELLECLDALDFFELASAEMEDAHVLERRADVSEGRNNRIVELEVLEAGEDLSRHLQIVEPRIDAQLNLRQQCQVRLVNTPKLLHKELFIKINDILNLLSLNNLKQLLLDILKSIDILNLTLLFKGLIGPRICSIQIVQRLQIVNHVAIIHERLIIPLIAFLILLVRVLLVLGAAGRPGYFVLRIKPPLDLLILATVCTSSILCILLLINLDSLGRRILPRLNGRRLFASRHRAALHLLLLLPAIIIKHLLHQHILCRGECVICCSLTPVLL